MAKYEIEGMRALQNSIDKIGKVPQKCVTPAARKGMNEAIKDGRRKAPVDTGELKKGMKLNGERSRFKGKKVYRVIFDPAKNDIFQKKNKDGKIIGYYPYSQEYGFFAKNGRYIPGYNFLRNSLIDNKNIIEKVIVREMEKNIMKAWEGK